MLGKRSRSVIGRLSELLVPCSRSFLAESPLDPFLLPGRSQNNNHQNPIPNNKAANNNNNNSHSSRNFDLGRHGVGLGIVVALEKPLSQSSSFGSGGGTGPRSKYFVSSPGGYSRSEPEDGLAEEEEEEEEDYTYVTFHGPRASFTMVYHDQIEKERSEAEDQDGGCDVQGFLSCCQLCGKNLHGQDIYMYRGEKGFCSAECRSAQITMDERSEQCRSEVADTWSYSSAAAFSEGQIFPTSILAV